MLPVLLCTALLSGCGAWQSVANGTTDAFDAVFYKRVEVVKVDVTARESLNPDDAGRATSVTVRVYQLKDRKQFDATSYSDLLIQDRTVLAGEVQASVAGVLNPAAALSLAQPMETDVNYVAVVAFFRKPDRQGTWKFVIPAKQLDADAPLKLELVDWQIDQVNGKPLDIDYRSASR
ncbi:type VI secretion system-associated lipoprotein [Pandoraea norimbergensis]|uniref:Type VI secretion protein n=1 Tax=Pandoraea norimbergensis TaxID=93219 RepID=A0ABN4JQH2_9BURK|nr:type VI secretion system-associated lipoprotein [Pandoraea norimbergensis]